MAQHEMLPDGLIYDCKQRKGGKEAERVLGSSKAHLPAHLMWSFLSSKRHFTYLFPMTIQHGFKPESIHSLPLLILYI